METIVATIVESVMTPIWHQLGYLIHYDKNIENLRHKLEKLEGLRNDLQGSIDAAIKNGEEIQNDVKDWITKVDEFKVEAIKFLEEYGNLNERLLNGWFPDFITRYRVGKCAKKQIMEANELHRNGMFRNISNPATPLGVQFMFSGNFVIYETTKLAMKEVMKAMKDENINLIGIHGIGGVGKTTLVKTVGKKCKEDKLFDEIVMAVVSQNIDLKRIQGQMADMLGLKFTEESETGRADRLYARLKGVNNILVILDDVWARLDLAAVGIPFGNDQKGCKILITTRRMQICNVMGMGCQTTKVIHLDVLSEQESWDLFRRNAGDAINSLPLNVVAKEITKECRGLPVAIVTVGRAMRDKDLNEWKEAAQELKNSVPRNIEGVEEEVFRCLKLSYDHLRDEEAKSCFLLCSLFPEDHDILIETLVRYALGLEIFENVDTVQDARRRANSVINNLKASCLLMHSDEEGCIKMHDVIRDVAISIGSYKYLVRAGVNLKEWPNKKILDHHTGISLMENRISRHPDVWEKPNLALLLLQGNSLAWNASFFEGMKALRVLDLSYTSRRGIDFSPSFGFLTCLQTLVLEGMRLWDTTSLGQIKTLEVLSFRHCAFGRSPTAIRHLTNLRLLDMTSCWQHNAGLILPNMISCLSRLEELYLAGTETKWEFTNELNSLSRLTALTIRINEKLLASLSEDFVFPVLEVFIIYVREFHPSNYLELCAGTRSTVWWRKCVKLLLKRTNHLKLDRFVGTTNIIPNLLYHGEGLNILERLWVYECHEFEYLINTEECRMLPDMQQHQQVLCNLKDLFLSHLGTFKGICNGVLLSTVSLSKLRILTIDTCVELSKVILPFYLLKRLLELETLQIKNCGALEQVFDFEFGVKRHDLQVLSSLRVLELIGLPRLKHIWKCPSQLVNLHNLRVVSISDCNGLKNLFTLYIALSFWELEELICSSCNQLEEIVGKESGGQNEVEPVDKIVFKRLKKLKLDDLSNLTGFCMGSFPFEWPSLEGVIVNKCHKMKTFTAPATVSGIVSMPKLKAIKVDGVEILLEGLDLNTIMQNHFKEKETPPISNVLEPER